MDSDELEPRKPKTAPIALDRMGIAELEAYIAGLESEIARARAQIGLKQRDRAAAEALFGKR